ncbi:uncharacterized protein H6S33_006969 [Morchella sextelata]|uniref:uncharacterized protein n=1 Tax=Morchella sextelata TaxID=1174677 RepID=UPI001D03792B|nr:uncharacterized protein H6S33_006969 [Morchella sextelata]KAH0603938.1 hypothetical protein H6S33_006969 [Morchella sextelata]
MGDPLSVLASIGGLIAIGTSLVTGLTTTISKARSAPASIQALSKELKTLCTALSNLETVFKLPDVLRNPLFPVDILSELLENIMADFVAVQKEVGSYTARPEAGALQQVWRQFRWSFREGDVRELRDDIAAYKATIVMTISAANFATTCSSALANSVEFSTLQASISELRANLSYCTHVNQCLRSSCTAIRSRCCSRARSQDNRRQSQHSAISRSSSQRTPRQQNVQHSATSDERSGTISGSLRSMKTFLTRSTSGSGSYSYRAESILDLYCASIRSMRQASIRQLDRALGPEVERGPEWNEDLNGQLHSDGDGDGTLYPNLQFNNDPQQQRGDGYESVFVMDPSPHSTELSGNAVVADPPLSQPQPLQFQLYITDSALHIYKAPAMRGTNKLWLR